MNKTDEAHIKAAGRADVRVAREPTSTGVRGEGEGGGAWAQGVSPPEEGGGNLPPSLSARVR